MTAGGGTQVTVRRATRTDARDLAAMRWDCKAERHELDRQERERFLDRQLSWFTEAIEGDWVVFVAEADKRLVGQVFVRVVDKVPSPTPQPTAIGYVTNFWVDPSRRGHGLGGELLLAMRAWAEQVPLDALVVWPTDDWVPDYERVGFRGDQVLHLPITPA